MRSWHSSVSSRSSVRLAWASRASIRPDPITSSSACRPSETTSCRWCNKRRLRLPTPWSSCIPRKCPSSTSTTSSCPNASCARASPMAYLTSRQCAPASFPGNDAKKWRFGVCTIRHFGTTCLVIRHAARAALVAPNGTQALFVANATVLASKGAILNCIRVLC